jgi:large subunit ribosomal protein L18
MIKMKRKLPTYKMPFNRRRKGKTNYKKRLKLLVSKTPRLVVRKSLNYITAQIINFGPKGDITLASATSKELKKLRWKFSFDTVPAAYLTGLLLGKKAREKGISEAILDSGLYPSTKGSRIYAVVKGAIDAGLKVPVNPEVFPIEDRLTGKHLSKFNEKFQILPKIFKDVKEKILGE